MGGPPSRVGRKWPPRSGTLHRGPALKQVATPPSERTCPSDRLGRARPAATTSEAAAPRHFGHSPANGKRVTLAPAGQQQPPSPGPVLWKLARRPPPPSPSRMRSGESHAHVLSLPPASGLALREVVPSIYKGLRPCPPTARSECGRVRKGTCAACGVA
eukprot:scaffold2879_cov269-Prasinococcus_capsulatus_cf.AAC.33